MVRFLLRRLASESLFHQDSNGIPRTATAGSPSSELHTTYFSPAYCLGMKLHLSPVGKPAPPRPRNALFFTSATTWSGGVFSARIFFRAS